MRISIIISNYNYAEYIEDAIKSALSVDWPDIEIIVVDDGSTDGSRGIIAKFGDNVTIIYQDNSSQRVACNNGFAVSTGDVIIFLDSDDMLLPSIGQEIAKSWRPGISKIQFQMERMTAKGQITGSIFPAFEPMPSPELIRHWAFTTTAYPTPPGSGNAYARTFLEKIFPIDDSCGAFSDSACLATAPFLGEVITIRKPLVLYRVHRNNDSNLTASDSNYAREVARALARVRYAKRICAGNVSLSEENIFKSLHLLQHRVPSLRLTPKEHPLPEDSRSRALFDAFRALWSFPMMSLRNRIVVCGWAVMTLLAPLNISRWLIKRRFSRF